MVGSAHRPQGTIGLRPSLGPVDIRGQNPLDLSQPAACPRLDLSSDDPIAVMISAPGFHECSEFFNTPAPTRPARLGLYRQSARHAAHRRSQGQRRDRRADPPLAGPVTRAFVFLSDVVDGAFLLGGTAPSGHRPDLWATTMTNTRSLSGAPLVSPGGFIVVDNISGGEPLHAARDTCANARLAGCGNSLEASPLARSSTSSASTIRGTDLGLRRASTRLCRFAARARGLACVDRARSGGIEPPIAHRASRRLHA